MVRTILVVDERRFDFDRTIRQRVVTMGYNVAIYGPLGRTAIIVDRQIDAVPERLKFGFNYRMFVIEASRIPYMAIPCGSYAEGRITAQVTREDVGRSRSRLQQSVVVQGPNLKQVSDWYDQLLAGKKNDCCLHPAQELERPVDLHDVLKKAHDRYMRTKRAATRDQLIELLEEMFKLLPSEQDGSTGDYTLDELANVLDRIRSHGMASKADWDSADELLHQAAVSRSVSFDKERAAALWHELQSIIRAHFGPEDRASMVAAELGGELNLTVNDAGVLVVVDGEEVRQAYEDLKAALSLVTEEGDHLNELVWELGRKLSFRR
jgi:hypothetical protein